MKTSSIKTAKYQPLSYFIENNLIIYSSLNRINKLVAFTIIQTQDVSKLIQVLKNILMKSCLDSYTIQIGIRSVSYIILKFINEEKKEIIQDCFKIREFLNEAEIQYSLLENNHLKMVFFSILCNEVDPTLSEIGVSVSKSKIRLSINNDKPSLNYVFYNINLDLLTDEIYFFQHITRFLEEREIRGYLFVYYTVDNIGDLKGGAYLAVLQREEEDSIDLIKMSREFFKKELLEIQVPKIDLTWRFLWRLPMCDDLFRIKVGFKMGQQKIPSTTNEVISHLKGKLAENDIKYKTVEEHLFLIIQKYLFSIISGLDLNRVTAIIKEYINEYKIYILLINKTDYSKLISYDNISQIPSLTILNIEEFLDLNYDTFN